MDPAVSQKQNQDQPVPAQPQQAAFPTGNIQKEQEPIAVPKTEVIGHKTSEVEIPPEVERAGVTKFSDTIELPPDVKKLGVTHTGPSVPITPVTTTVLPSVALPISDNQVVAGLHAQVVSALRWLAEWCMRRLKKAHIALKEAHGKVMRVKS